jgi:hypothetical protein
MRVARIAVALLLAAGSSLAADPVYLDELAETPLASLQQNFPKLKNEGCYQLYADRFLLITMDKKDQKPWRVVVSTIAPCRRPEPGPQLDVRERAGVELGHSVVQVVGSIGRPDATAPPDAALRRLGELEYFYICRVSEGCARHTSVFIKDGVVTAIAEWYSE